MPTLPHQNSAILLVSVMLGALVGPPTIARGDDAPTPIALELNRLEAQGDACRAYLLIDNSRGEAWRSLKLDLFVLNLDGVVEKRLGLETAPIAARKTSIRVFDLAALPCPSIGRILLNDVLACEAVSGTRTDCLDRIETRSKVASVSLSK